MALGSMLRIANENHLRTLAVPAIGTGMFKFPPILAARLMAQALAKAGELAPHLKWVRICLADQAMLPLYESAFAQAGLHPSKVTSSASIISLPGLELQTCA